MIGPLELGTGAGIMDPGEALVIVDVCRHEQPRAICKFRDTVGCTQANRTKRRSPNWRNSLQNVCFAHIFGSAPELLLI
jgi:hypothetical protein